MKMSVLAYFYSKRGYMVRHMPVKVVLAWGSNGHDPVFHFHFSFKIYLTGNVYIIYIVLKVI